MKEGWTKRWKILLIWASGYLSFIAFAIVGGYAIVKSEDKELKDAAKKVFIVTLIFTAISMFFTLYSGIGGLSDNYYSSGAYTAYSVLQLITNIAKIVVYVVFAALSFFNVKLVAANQGTGQDDVKEESKEEKVEENTSEKGTTI